MMAPRHVNSVKAPLAAAGSCRAGLSVGPLDQCDEATKYYSQLLKVTDNGAKTHRPEVSYAHNYVQKQ
jgi:hypothetical protein